MNSHSQTYFLIDGGRGAFNEAESKWQQSFLDRIHCKCGLRLPCEEKIDVYLAERPIKVAVNSVDGSSVGIASEQFINAVGVDLFDECFLRGEVYVGSSDRPLSDYFSFIGRSCIQLRGTKSSMYSFCDSCMRPSYVAFGAQYVLSDDVPADHPILATHRSPILLRDDLIEQVKKSRVKIRPKQVKVLDEPRDGLPHDLSVAR